jgi:hypothetical protein
MGVMTAASNESDEFNRDELKALQVQLESLARENTAYPLEYSLGACDFLFESRQDIEVIVDNLTEEILIRPRAA